jgi:hypothetical protein
LRTISEKKNKKLFYVVFLLKKHLANCFRKQKTIVKAFEIFFFKTVFTYEKKTENCLAFIHIFFFVFLGFLKKKKIGNPSDNFVTLNNERDRSLEAIG